MYPSVKSPTFQTDLLRKPEFLEVRTPLEDWTGDMEELKRVRASLCSRHDFRLANHQLFLKRFFSPHTPFNFAIIDHGLGTGKSCTAVSIAEEYLMQPQNETTPVIVVCSPTVQSNFKRTVFSIANVIHTPAGWISRQCTGDTYLQKVSRMQRAAFNLDSASDRARLEVEVDRLINRLYSIQGYLSFANRVLEKQRSLSEEMFASWVKEEFSNRLLIVDEAHAIRPGVAGSEKRVEQALRAITHYAENLRLVLMTATPMYNKFSEIIWTLNLACWVDRRLDLFGDNEEKWSAGFSASDFWTSSSEATFRPGMEMVFRSLVRSYVSFVRGDDPRLFPFRLDAPDAVTGDDLPSLDAAGRPIPPGSRIEKLKLVLSPRGDRQKKLSASAAASIAKHLEEDDTDDEDVSDDEGSPTTNTFLSLSEDNVSYPAKPPFLYKTGGKLAYNGPTRFLSPGQLHKWAPKIARIVKAIESAPDGVVLVYSNFVQNGCIPVAMALEEAGYHPYKKPDGFLEGTGPKKKGAYLLLTGPTRLNPRPGDFEAEVGVARHPDNRDGKLVRVIIGSRRINEGIDFRFIRQLHVLDSWHNLSLIDQAIGRAIRTMSHCLLPFEKQNCTVYLHAIDDGDGRESTDIAVYRLAETKARAIGKITNLLQESALDCAVNLGINKLSPGLLSLQISQIRSEDGATVVKTVGELTSPLFSEALTQCVPAGAAAEGPPPPPRERDKYVPVDLLEDRQDEVLDVLHQLFRENVLLSWREIAGDPRMTRYSEQTVAAVLTLATSQPAKYPFVDGRGQTGILEKSTGGAGDTYAFRANSIRDLREPTVAERTLVSHPAPTFSEPLEGKRVLRLAADDDEAGGDESAAAAAGPEDWRKWLEKTRKLLGGLEPLDETVLVQLAWDTYALPRRRAAAPAPPDAPEAAVPGPEGSSLVLELDGAVETIPAVSEFALRAFRDSFRAAYIKIPEGVTIGFTEFVVTKRRFEHKIITSKLDIRGRGCAHFSPEALDALKGTLGYKAGPGVTADLPESKATVCTKVDYLLRLRARDHPEDTRYYRPEQRALVSGLRTRDLRV